MLAFHLPTTVDKEPIFISIALMLIASTGVLPAIIGALLQEVIDTVSILYALKALKDRK